MLGLQTNKNVTHFEGPLLYKAPTLSTSHVPEEGSDAFRKVEYITSGTPEHWDTRTCTPQHCGFRFQSYTLSKKYTESNMVIEMQVACSRALPDPPVTLKREKVAVTTENGDALASAQRGVNK